MNAAASSCRTWTKRILSCRLRSASMMPLMPSPGMPNTVSTCHLISVSTRMSRCGGRGHTKPSGRRRIIRRALFADVALFAKRSRAEVPPIGERESGTSSDGLSLKMQTAFLQEDDRCVQAAHESEGQRTFAVIWTSATR